jgi:hypothetical protein
MLIYQLFVAIKHMIRWQKNRIFIAAPNSIYKRLSLAIKSTPGTRPEQTLLSPRARAKRAAVAELLYIYSPKHAHEQHTALIQAEIGFFE